MVSVWFKVRLLSVLLVSRQCVSVKPCLHLARLRYDEPECQTPRMTRSYCQNTTSCHKSLSSSSSHDACDLVTQSFLAEFEVFDVVMIPAGLCQAEIREGEFTYKDAEDVLPINEELIYVRMRGDELQTVLQHGINQPLTKAQPKLAGVKFETRELLHGRMHLYNIETLGSGCSWKSLDKAAKYNVLTVESLVGGKFGYHFLPQGTTIETSGRASRMQRFLRDMFWQFTNNVCEVRDPFRKPVKATRPMRFNREETVIIPGNCRRNSTYIM